MEHRYLIGTDIGTSSTKTVMTDEHGNVLAAATEAYGLLCPQNAWAEQWPDVWEEAAKSTIRQVVKKSGVDAKQVAALCISGLYGGSGIPLDRDMQVVRPCIIWMDRRSEEICKRIKETTDVQRMFDITENGVDSYFGYAKMLWIKENEPENLLNVYRTVRKNVPELSEKQTARLCALEPGGETNLPAGWKALRTKKRLHLLLRAAVYDAGGAPFETAPCAVTIRGDGIREAAFDAKKLEGAIFRARRDGDVFAPLGMEGEQKLKKTLQDAGVDRPFRDLIPVLAKGDRILWIAGLKP